ncbi:M1 family metallopeptidase [Skermania sp. ID1734]|uniref:M1 family metallopeptidase n=1 Tax=Skermania sp. ID1734 TaxID=2597516 RepID=UPI00117C944C|nr:M1 family metallopeptidase [Skermania sp. ID1734]TSD95586.1 M1 family metallopeptidase [Skermania sp. ID1734]
MWSGTDDEPLDSYLPGSGNRGYRVSRYELDLDYEPARNRLSGTATIVATATESRHAFTLDLSQSMQVTAVTVNGTAAQPTHQHRKLTVRPAQHVPAGGLLSIVVQYAGQPRPHPGPRTPIGWQQFADGVIVTDEPDGAATWFPCNDHPSTKATYAISITTAAALYVVANGTLVRKKADGPHITWAYEQAQPLATSRVTVQIGTYERHRLGRSSVPVSTIADRSLRTDVERDFARVPEMLTAFERFFGAYPFADYTLVIADVDVAVPIAAAGLSVYGINHCDGQGNAERLAARQLAQQWFGGSLTVRRWKDIWLHDGFSTYAEWLWSEAAGGPATEQLARAARHNLSRQPADIVAADPGPNSMFDSRVGKRGALALHSLRLELGSNRFFELLHDWTARHRYGSVSADEFTDLAAHYTHIPLWPLWDNWLYQAALPHLPPR